eukprot:gene15682-21216_t
MSSKRKSGLKTRDVSKTHFSSGINNNQHTFSRLVLRIIDGTSLLASDVQTGKSDPVCFIWCGMLSEDPPKLEELTTNENVLVTKVCPTTCDPIWNEDVIFPLDLSEGLDHLLQTRIIVFVRDQDIDVNDESILTYDELGMLEISFQNIVGGGKAMAHSIVLSAAKYNLIKSPGMRKIDGSIRVSASIIFSSEDEEINKKRYELSDGFETNNSKSNSLSQYLQKQVRPNTANSNNSNNRGDSISPSVTRGRMRRTIDSFDGRQSTASSRSPSRERLGSVTGSINTRSNVAPMKKRPSTAPTERLQTIPAGSIDGENMSLISNFMNDDNQRDVEDDPNEVGLDKYLEDIVEENEHLVTDMVDAVVSLHKVMNPNDDNQSNNSNQTNSKTNKNNEQKRRNSLPKVVSSENLKPKNVEQENNNGLSLDEHFLTGPTGGDEGSLPPEDDDDYRLDTVGDSDPRKVKKNPFLQSPKAAAIHELIQSSIIPPKGDELSLPP